MQYFFLLGNNPALSIAEIQAVWPQGVGKLADNNIFLFNISENIAKEPVLKRLGGTIKFGLIKKEVPSLSPQSLLLEISELLDEKLKTIPDKKFIFGISNYTSKPLPEKIIGMETKKYLRENGVNGRWVTSREKSLSSVVVEQNKIISKGIEIVIISDGPKNYLAQTLEVQPFKELSFRDYGRPTRDDLSGMLPPKLAQIMINLAGIKKTDSLLDPFCGSGTIITEAALMGYQNIIGSDISDKAVLDTKNNLTWIQNKFNLPPIKTKLFLSSATELTRILKPQTVAAIATEPYLGPQRGWHEISQTISELDHLYSQSLKEFKKILLPSGRVVMIWPVFMKGETPKYLKPNYNDYEIINPLTEDIINSKNIKISPRQTIIYGRPGQKVWREIVILKLKKS